MLRRFRCVPIFLKNMQLLDKTQTVFTAALRLHYTQLFPDPRFLLLVLQNIAGYKNAVECLLQ